MAGSGSGTSGPPLVVPRVDSDMKVRRDSDIDDEDTPKNQKPSPKLKLKFFQKARIPKYSELFKQGYLNYCGFLPGGCRGAEKLGSGSALRGIKSSKRRSDRVSRESNT